jgi:hypothetical protein
VTFVILVRSPTGDGWYPIFELDKRGIARMCEYATREEAEAEAPKSAYAFGYVVLEVAE